MGNNFFASLKTWLRFKNRNRFDDETETFISPEIFSADQMERYAIILARGHELTSSSNGNVLLERLAKNEETIRRAHEILNRKIADNDNYSPASEWLLDNYYLIQAHILRIKRNLSKPYRALPQLRGGYPRIYDITMQIIEHGDGHWNIENLQRFLTAYQSVTLLTLRELWSIPMMLGIALIENLAKTSKRIVAARNDIAIASDWADRMIEVAEEEPKQLITVLADMARAKPPLTSSFVAELARRFQNAALALPLLYLEQHLSEEGASVEQFIQNENMQKAANQVTVGNIIESLRRIDTANWHNFVEELSVVEQILRLDPTGTYSRMDFDTRDHYRHAIEDLSQMSVKTEVEVASLAIELAKNKSDLTLVAHEDENPEKVRLGHVGYYLIDKGLSQLEKKVDAHFSLWCKLSRHCRKHTLQLYFSSILLITVALVSLIFPALKQTGLSNAWLVLIVFALVIFTSQFAINIINQIATLLIKPTILPRMDFSKEIPIHSKSVVVVPTLLSNIHKIEVEIKDLEIRFLANQDQHLYFVLLSDFKDALQEHMPEDTALLHFAQKEIQALNARHKTNDDIFFLFHRGREWNAKQEQWMGRERKRGKLIDFNSYLRGKKKSAFSYIVGDTHVLENIKYVITLDSDTQLPRDTARKLVATMAHPLNWPSLDPEKQCVVSGYGILQPRMVESLSEAGPTRFVRICGGDFGIDPYTRTVSNIYQDLFNEGSFIGKGIYDVDLYDQVLTTRFPDNLILSHDLLEGCYLHSGFLSDVTLYENMPGNYLNDAKRRIRWIRGDWQLLTWLLPRIYNGKNQKVPNPLSALSKFKIFDNLRRSLVPVSLLLLLGISLTVLSPAYLWVSIFIAILIFPTLISLLVNILCKPKDISLPQHFNQLFHEIEREFSQFFLYLSCLPYEAWYSLRAIAVTLFRIFISKKYLLEWIPSDQVVCRAENKLSTWFISMWSGPVIAFLLVCILLTQEKFFASIVGIALLGLWFFSPLIARWFSQPSFTFKSQLHSEQKHFLRCVARKTWEYFNVFVTADNNWLPPDNFQEAPREAIAHRTSPTNIGLSLLANLTAYDFNYIHLNQLLQRTQNAFQTLDKIERFKGHLYNWYNTKTLEPLKPRYISTVDTGNFVGHILTLRQGLLGLPDDILLKPELLDGLQDTFDVLTISFHASIPKTALAFQELLHASRASFTSWSNAFAASQKLCHAAKELSLSTSTEESNLWSAQLLSECILLHEHIALFATIPYLPKNATLKTIAAMDAAPEKHPNITQAIEMLNTIHSLADQALLFTQVDLQFLQSENYLFAIGFNADDQRLDSSKYDLLSSEIRLTIFFAIAYGHITQESWFALGRQFVSSGGEPILISWSGSMFEYLMPLLVMPTYPFTLLDQTYRTAVTRQISYGKQHDVPWGVSESGFNAFDSQYNYLYRAFGVPGLGLKRGLENDLVIAPYACAMALMVAPEAACLNLQHMAEFALGKYGFYEAIDFTKARLAHEANRAVLRSFMTHHQGMSLLAFSYVLHNKPMQRRFVADPFFKATLLLLQERFPKMINTSLKIPPSNETTPLGRPDTSMRVFNHPNTRTPQVIMLSNGNYHTVLTQAGGGYSRYKNTAITRWREDSTSDNWGLFTYVRDVSSGTFYSPTYQPTLNDPKNIKCIFTESRASFQRTQDMLDMSMEIVVSPEDDVELRRCRIHNRSSYTRTIEFTSFGEIVLAKQSDDLAAPSFSNLFVETEIIPASHVILAKRRTSEEQQTPWLYHLLNVYSDNTYKLSFETDRTHFIGRNRSLAEPLALLNKGDLSNTSGPVLDPIFAIRCCLKLEADAFVDFDLLTGVADTRENCIKLVGKYQDRSLANRIFEMAWTHSQVLLHQLNITEAEAQVYGRLASPIIYSSKTRRADPSILTSNRHGQSGLWGFSISGDLPIVLLQIEDSVNIEIVHQLIKAHTYWRRKGLEVDVVILNNEQYSYRQTLQDQIMSLIKVATAATEHTGSIIVHRVDQMSADDLILLQSVARVLLTDKRGTLKEQMSPRRSTGTTMPPLHINKASYRMLIHKELPPLPQDLQFFNSIGGFNALGDEYIIRLKENETTPAPWCNVLANPNFGTLVSDSGQVYTWIENSQQFRLTPWENDPLLDTTGEAFYIRDDLSGIFWSPTPLPRRGHGDYQIRHGFGYSVFEHIEDGVYSELTVYVDLNDAVKFCKLIIRNDSPRKRSLSVMGFVTWVLGDLRSKNAMYIVTESAKNGSLFAQNHYNTDFGERTAFFASHTSTSELCQRTVTCDRTEFLGRNGTLRRPAALKRKGLSGRVGAGYDPCGAIQMAFDLAEGKSREILFLLGAGENKQQADALVQRYRNLENAQIAFEGVRQFWQQRLGMLKVETPDHALNLLVNGWLLYQVISSRLWGRTGYYQSSGAFGYRDQLQDVMSLSHCAPELYRAHLLLCAAHQFEEGDVQHWWHPPLNRGVRTRCSDDYLWLPFSLYHYIEATHDFSVLDEPISFIKGRPLQPHEESYYDAPLKSDETASLYQHAVRAIKNGLKFGSHGLPLMGSGDWNDGMNLVGKDGQGESVWLGFFLYKVLKLFSTLATQQGDTEFAALCDSESKKLQTQIEANSWDGKWYRRAYFDDGTPLGSVENEECRIDSIAQSWSVISGAADLNRSKEAMNSLYHYLVDPAAKLVKLLDPPFNKSHPNPGYIQAYLPGIRENGGQYTHAAPWAIKAFAELGENKKAWQLVSFINPIHHARNVDEIMRYKIEPYVTAGDVYSVDPHNGRGGWSWYTGSAGWLYNVITETLLGVRLEHGTQLHLSPRLPQEWENFTLHYRYANTMYKIILQKTEDKTKMVLDDVELEENIIHLENDGKTHHINYYIQRTARDD